MIYMLEIRYDPTVPVDPNRPSRQAEHAALERELAAQGTFRGGGAFARSNRRYQVRQGEVLKLDGPFAETKEALGGFFLVECETPEEAFEIAKRIPTEEHAWIEVLRLWLWHPENLPGGSPT